MISLGNAAEADGDVMRFEWDETKRRANIRKHMFDFLDAPEIFAGPILVSFDIREYGENRWIGIGLLRMRTVTVVFTDPTEDLIRIISLRKATRYERERFEETLRDGLGPY